MIEPDRIALVLLAAGQSRRFGSNKLAAMLDGAELLRHATRAYGALPFVARIVVAGPATPDLSDLGFRAVALQPPTAPQSASLAQGIAAIEHIDVDAVLIALGDMPQVGRAHVLRLFRAFRGKAIASSHRGIPSPPALFPRSDFAALQKQNGDRGAQSLLARAQTIAAPAGELDDIDTPEDLARLAKRT